MGAMSIEAEYEAEIERRNFTRAAKLADEAELGESLVTEAREQAFMQSLGEWFNFRSADAMAREWGFSRDKVVALCDQILDKFKRREEHEGREFKVFDINRMDHATALKLISQFRDGFR